MVLNLCRSWALWHSVPLSSTYPPLFIPQSHNPPQHFAEKMHTFQGKYVAQGPRDLLRFWFPNEIFSLTQNPLFLAYHPASPWLAQQFTKHIRRQASRLPPQRTPTLLLRNGRQAMSRDPVTPGVRFLRWHFMETNLPQKPAPASGWFSSPACFTLPGESLQLPPFSKGIYYRETQRLRQVLTTTLTYFCWTKDTKLGNYQTISLGRKKLFRNTGYLPEVSFKD